MKKLITFSIVVLFAIFISTPVSSEEVIDSSFTIENVWKEINKDSILYPEIVFRQFLWETGWGKSSLCLNRNNLFGFRSTGGYMRFNTWQESVAYYKRWQQRKYQGGDYYQFLIDIKYAEDGFHYVNCLKSLTLPSFIYE